MCNRLMADHPEIFGVTSSADQEAAAVTPLPHDPRWMTLANELIEARKEIHGVMAGCDGFSFLADFPEAHIAVNDALHDLRRALLHVEDAISFTLKKRPADAR